MEEKKTRGGFAKDIVEISLKSNSSLILLSFSQRTARKKAKTVGKEKRKKKYVNVEKGVRLAKMENYRFGY